MAEGLLESAPLLRLADAPRRVRFGGLTDSLAGEFNARNGMLYGVSLSAGGFVAIDATRVLWFNHDGQFLHAWEQEGAGPGEARLLGSLCATHGDTVVAYDVALGRLSVFPAPGPPAYQLATDRYAMLPRQGCFANGMVILQGYTNRSDEEGSGGLLHVMDLKGAARDSLGPFVALSAMVQVTVAASDSFVWVGDPRTPRLRLFTRRGHELRGILLREPNREMSEEDAHARRLFSAARSNTRGKRDPSISALDRQVPRYSRLLAMRGGGIWLNLPREEQQSSSTWVGLCRDGRFLGKVEIPFDDDSVEPLLLEVQRTQLLVLRKHPDVGAVMEVIPFATPMPPFRNC